MQRSETLSVSPMKARSTIRLTLLGRVLAHRLRSDAKAELADVALDAEAAILPIAEIMRQRDAAIAARAA